MYVSRFHNLRLRLPTTDSQQPRSVTYYVEYVPHMPSIGRGVFFFVKRFSSHHQLSTTFSLDPFFFTLNNIFSHRWPGYGWTHRPYWPYTTTWSRKTTGSACHTRTIGRGIYTSRRWGNPIRDGTCVRSTRTRWKVNSDSWILSVCTSYGIIEIRGW